MSKTYCESIHKKAIRLIEGGIVEVDGLSVRAVKSESRWGCCGLCKMDCLCHFGTEVLDVCVECDSITDCNYRLELINEK